MSANCSYLTLMGKVQVEPWLWVPTPSPVRRGTNPLHDTSKIAAELQYRLNVTLCLLTEKWDEHSGDKCHTPHY